MSRYVPPRGFGKNYGELNSIPASSESASKGRHAEREFIDSAKPATTAFAYPSQPPNNGWQGDIDKFKAAPPNRTRKGKPSPGPG